MRPTTEYPNCDGFVGREQRTCLHYEIQSELKKDIDDWRLWTEAGVEAASAVAIVANVVFLSLIVLGFRHKFLTSKRYFSFAARSVMDTLVAIYTVVFLRTKFLYRGHSKSHILCGEQIFETLITMDCLVISGVYASVAVLTYVAVKLPLKYQNFARVRTVTIWLLAIGVSSLAVSVILVEFVYGVNPNGIVELLANPAANGNSAQYSSQVLDVEDADNWLFLVGPSVANALAIGSYVYVVIVLLRQHSFNARRQKPSVWRLGVNIGFFTLSTALLVVLSLGVLHIDRPGKNATQQAQSLRGDPLLDAYRAVDLYTRIEMVATVCWFGRMTVDPLFNVILDPFILSEIKTLVWTRRCATRPHRPTARYQSRSTQYTNVSQKLLSPPKVSEV